MRRMLAVVPMVCLLAWSTAAPGQQGQPDLRAYANTTLQQALAGAPKSPKAAYELELEDAGQRHWLLLGSPALFNMYDVKPRQRHVYLVHRIGFAHGRPVAVIYLIATPQQMRDAERAPRSEPAQPGEARAAR